MSASRGHGRPGPQAGQDGTAGSPVGSRRIAGKRKDIRTDEEKHTEHWRRTRENPKLQANNNLERRARHVVGELYL